MPPFPSHVYVWCKPGLRVRTEIGIPPHPHFFPIDPVKFTIKLIKGKQRFDSAMHFNYIVRILVIFSFYAFNQKASFKYSFKF